jgi:dihydroorotate dehydrogenase
MYKIIRTLLFIFPAETAHNLALDSLKIISKLIKLSLLFPVPTVESKEIIGLKFKNTVGLAAGLDKNGDYIDELADLGFGFIEVGTVTPFPQDGNPKPRLFRLPKKQAIINRMGFNNKGVNHLIENVKKYQIKNKNNKDKAIIGVNIGKNFNTSLENALEDYLICLHKVYEYADYIVINISSPNTPNLRKLQHGESFNNMLAGLTEMRTKLATQYRKYKPLLIKIAPDLSSKELENIAYSLLKYKIDAVIATNTTSSRANIEHLKYSNENGGLSGMPLLNKSTKIVEQLHTFTQGKLPIIAVGGITDEKSAQNKFTAGASLIQIYTGFIYKGPNLITRIINNI